ncbi:MAG: hypothetical protein AB1805_07535 [Nitrospirota bacterium]
MKLLTALKHLSPIQKLKYRFFKRRVDRAQRLLFGMNDCLRRMGYNRGARKRYWKEIVRNIETTVNRDA